MHDAALRGVEWLAASGADLVIVPQNLTEFWNVATRPTQRNGLGMSPVETRAEIDRLTDNFRLLPDIASIFAIWLRLVTDYSITGIDTYDTRLVACMEAHRIDTLLTFDVGDFRRFTRIQTVHPDSVGETRSH